MTGETVTVDYITTTYHPNIEKSIVVDGESDDTLSPKEISSFSGNMVACPLMKASDGVSCVTSPGFQVGDSGCQGDTSESQEREKVLAIVGELLKEMSEELLGADRDN